MKRQEESKTSAGERPACQIITRRREEIRRGGKKPRSRRLHRSKDLCGSKVLYRDRIISGSKVRLGSNSLLRNR
jgi:hypothetical protein